MPDTPRRLLLRVALKLLSVTAIVIIAIALFSGHDDSPDKPRARPPLSLSLDTLAADQPQRIEWQGGPLQLLRTAQGELHLFYDRGGNLGCPLVWQPPGVASAPEQPWQGGFRDQCSATWYRRNGKVLPGQDTSRDLQSPPYRVDGHLLLIGVNGDNAAPAVPQ